MRTDYFRHNIARLKSVFRTIAASAHGSLLSFLGALKTMVLAASLLSAAA
jgi:hypothetical protein